jgi:hypothetical protein
LTRIFLFQAVDQVIRELVFAVVAECADKFAISFVADPARRTVLNETDKVSIVRFLPVYLFGVGETFAKFLL